ncbi:MAG TPA: zf-HC2 domain-containing protein [Acidimicrobiia bacterium]
MTHEEIQDLLEGYVDETLDRATRREVDAHLATCDECRAILEGVAPLDLGGIDPTAWTPRDMRRAVRRSMFRVAVDVVLLFIAVILVAWLVSLTLIHPLIINRGGRAEAATVATADLAVMLNPGATLTEYGYQTHFLSRTSEVTMAMPVGTSTQELGSLESMIGPLAFGDASGGSLFPFLFVYDEAIGGQDQLEAVDDGTVATVALGFETPLTMGQANELLESDADVRVVWAGFEVGDGSGLSSTGVLGYGTCGTPSIEVSGAIGASGGGSGSWSGEQASIDDALAETLRAVRNLIDHPELLDGIDVTAEEAESVLVELGDPQVASLVVTGPTKEIVAFIEEAAPDVVNVLALDFTNWFQPLCGR